MERVENRLLQYYVAVKPPSLVITLTGDIRASSDFVFGECFAEIRESPFSQVILSFQDVNQICPDQIPSFIKFQDELRKRGQIRLCYLRPDLVMMLLQSKAVRKEELSENFRAAVESLLAEA